MSKNDETLKDVEVIELNSETELTEEEIAEKAKEWEANFKASVIEHLDHFVPFAHFGALNINYLHPEIKIPSENEGEPAKVKADMDKAIGVDIVIRIGFGQEFPIPKDESENLE